TGYGLTLGVHSRIDETVDRITHGIQVGNVYVNRNQIGAVVGVQPFGGQGLSGTGPKAGGPHYLLRFATEKTVTVNTTAAGGNASLLTLGDRPPATDAQRQSPALAGLFLVNASTRSEAVLRRHTEQVGIAVVRTGDRVSAGGEVDLRVLRLEVGEREVHRQRLAHVPGGTDGVPATVVVGQARGAVRDAGRGLVVGHAAAQRPGVVELVLGAERHELRVGPLEGLDRVG